MRRHAAAAAKLRIFPDGAMRAVRFVSLRLASVWVPGAFVRRASEKPQGGGTWVVSFPAAFPMRFPCGWGGGLLLAFGLGGLVDEVHELVELRRDDDLRAAVALAADGGVVVGDGVILAAPGCRQALGVDAVIVLQGLDDGRGAQRREVPVVADVLLRDGHVVGVAFDQHVILLVVGDDFGNLREGLAGAFADFIRARLVEHVVGQRDVDYALDDLHVDFLAFLRGERAGELVGQGHVERVALVLGFDELLDELVRGVDLVDELGDVHAALRACGEALVERALERCVLRFEVRVVFPGFVQLLFEALARGGSGGDFHLRLLVGLGEFAVLGLKLVVVGLQALKLFLADAAGQQQAARDEGDGNQGSLHFLSFVPAFLPPWRGRAWPYLGRKLGIPFRMAKHVRLI